MTILNSFCDSRTLIVEAGASGWKFAGTRADGTPFEEALEPGPRVHVVARYGAVIAARGTESFLTGLSLAAELMAHKDLDELMDAFDVLLRAVFNQHRRDIRPPHAPEGDVRYPEGIVGGFSKSRGRIRAAMFSFDQESDEFELSDLSVPGFLITPWFKELTPQTGSEFAEVGLDAMPLEQFRQARQRHPRIAFDGSVLRVHVSDAGLSLSTRVVAGDLN
jgi:hypothetical protein